MVKMLGTEEKCSEKLPFAMLFAVEPAFTSISSEVLEKELRYNPELQINEESQLSLIVAGQTSTSVRRSTNTGSLPIPGTGDSDDDSMGDESK
ncbi:hypothetical protein PMG71_03515 [Roseofilum sp. BLCC_M154]|uniref:Uncharacterized protein n=1 Tax=Roseofilum acuticapitatum BLCC-M154 TaxID=3022444 RepID=A0ABT7ANM5_9CYAN|nr:hypothetical protein [Roseofilum acuticapitatum]MDJ1168491.1 hypothetical protein [Roseofilum acuticapitatum BLCC-M154]